jgi:MFS family permease
MQEPVTRLYTYKFWLLCSSSFLFFASFNLIIPELPDYLTSLGGGAHKGLIIPMFTLTAAISRPFSGRLTDTVGRIPVMIYGVIVCIVAGLLYPVMVTIAGFFFLRLLHGMSTGFKPTATSAYVGDIAPVSRRGEAMGIMGMFGSLGMAAGPAIGSLVAHRFGYDIMFYASSVFALLSILVVIRMPETLMPVQAFRWRLLKLRWKDVLEPRAYPAAIVMLLTTTSFGTILTLIPDLSKHLGLTNKGLFFTIFTISSLFTRLIAGRFSDRFGRVPVLGTGVMLYAITMLIIGYSGSLAVFYLAGILFGMAVGITSPTIFAWTVDLAHPQHRGRALATMFIALEIGIGIGGIVSGYSYNNDPDNFALAFIIPSVMCFLSVIYLVIYYRNNGDKPVTSN